MEGGRKEGSRERTEGMETLKDEGHIYEDKFNN